ncbi:g6563 [Coccomyxa viridis]|uniref:G6563 protein n=1 Tax=Coccomyxa viridis TaxID=1274662 RepID=A0ABP1G0N4_9CHLO
MVSPPPSPGSEPSRRGSAESLHRLTPMPSASMSWQRGPSGRLGSMSESDSAILNSTVTEEEGEGEEGSSAPASNQHTLGSGSKSRDAALPAPQVAAPRPPMGDASAYSGSGTSWENSPRDMREEDAHAIAARLGSYERTYSTEVPRFRSVGRQSEEIMPKPAKKMLARMKQDMGSTPKVSEAPQDEPLLPQPAPGQPGQPGHARKPSLGADATPRGGHARRKSLSDGEVLDPISKDEEADDVAIARFLRTCPGLSKSIVGDLLGQNTERCLRILDAFTHMFDFSGMSFEAAIRQFLESFKLPGEAQKIIRILEAWSRQFYAQEPGIFSSADAVYILAISVIMLNTDKHNPAIKKKMTQEEFVRNNRGINGTKDDPRDLPQEFLSELYNHFSEKAIRFPQLPSTLSQKESTSNADHTVIKAHKAAGASKRWDPLSFVCCR